MNWERLTSPEFEKAIKKCGKVCLLPIGVIEKHGDHLPLGQDTIYIHDVCTAAAEKETAMVFPFFFLGQILEAKHVPGTIALHHDILIPLLENLCDEIRRNGFTKIFIVNGHGGNLGFLNFFNKVILDKEKDYMVYIGFPWANNKEAEAITKAKIDGHGGECETSSMMYLHPELVNISRFGTYGMPLKRALKLKDSGLDSGIWWYSDYPGHFCADRTPCTKEKGKQFFTAHVNKVIEQIKLIKKDTVTIPLLKEFHQRAREPRNRYP